MPSTMTATQLRCPSCDQTQPPKKGGLILRIRAGGHHLTPTRVLGRCSGCGKMKFLISEPSGVAPAPAGSAEREMTLQELAAYVSENSMDIDTAEAIAASPAPEPRKRQIAALVAEGGLDKSEALRLLAI